MNWVHRAGAGETARAMRFLESRGLVAPRASLDRRLGAPPRSSVLYGDYDFLYFLSRAAEEQISDSVLADLRTHGLVGPRVSYDKHRYLELRERIKMSFVVPGTALSPAMERLLFMLASARRPRNVLGLGTFCGYTLAWTAGALRRTGGSSPKVRGIDLSLPMVGLARRNYRALGLPALVTLPCMDARVFAKRTRERFDYLYLDLDDPTTGKGIYLDLIEPLYEKLAPGAWVLAHDTTFPGFQKQLEGYFRFVRDPARFRASVSFPVDCYGLELSVK